ncbi:prefoldin subunit 1 [Selaginella moellendorffii]|uniref:prefoldin subunit 1 n=1 Tax=Selaginella moellendorffii TaxID=88036 RepID=UPI000D1C3A52|nr:prefoldin subunit 1 [Selaginella moellendorffii]|eukprot:XP_024517052.1 prefoldin subunit 1 [Selaginella moellendorffii]
MADTMNKEAVVELQAKLVDATAKLKQVQMQMRTKETEKKRALLTLDEINYLDDDTHTYKSVGKFSHVVFFVPEFFSFSRQSASKEYLERQLKEIEGNFKELLQQSPSLARQVMAMSVT